MADIIRMKTAYERAEPAGKKLLEKAKADYTKRHEDSKVASYQAAKEAATYIVHKRNGRVTLFGGSTYCCFECLYRLSKTCRECCNGSHFNKKGAN